MCVYSMCLSECVLHSAEFKGEICHSFASGGRRGETAGEGARQRKIGRMKKEEERVS